MAVQRAAAVRAILMAVPTPEKYSSSVQRLSGCTLVVLLDVWPTEVTKMSKSQLLWTTTLGVARAMAVKARLLRILEKRIVLVDVDFEDCIVQAVWLFAEGCCW